MGYPMAQQLRAKMPKSSKLVVCELSEAQRKNFIDETEHEGGIEPASSPREVVEQAVRPKQIPACLYT